MYRRVSLLGVHPDRALGPAVGDVHNGTLDGHPRSQRLHLVQIHVRMEPDAALAGAAKAGVLYPVAVKHPDRAVVHLHGNGNLQFPLGVFQSDDLIFRIAGVRRCLPKNCQNVVIRIVSLGTHKKCLTFQSF